MIRNLTKAGAKAIAIDIQFTEQTTPKQDDALIEAVVERPRRRPLDHGNRQARRKPDLRRRRSRPRNRRPRRRHGGAGRIGRDDAQDVLRVRRADQLPGRGRRSDDRRGRSRRSGIRKRRQGLDRLSRRPGNLPQRPLLAGAPRQGPGLGLPRQDGRDRRHRALAAGPARDLDHRRLADVGSRTAGQRDLDRRPRLPALLLGDRPRPAPDPAARRRPRRGDALAEAAAGARRRGRARARSTCSRPSSPSPPAPCCRSSTRCWR